MDIVFISLHLAVADPVFLARGSVNSLHSNFLTNLNVKIKEPVRGCHAPSGSATHQWTFSAMGFKVCAQRSISNHYLSILIMERYSGQGSFENVTEFCHFVI